MPVAGLLGTPYLSVFDIEMDFPGERMTLYAQPSCDTVSPSWTGPYVRQPLQALPNNMRLRTQDVASSVNVTTRARTDANAARLITEVQVNGHALRAMIDTGAQTAMSAATADVVGLTPDPKGQTFTAHGSDGHALQGELRFASNITIGDLVARNVPVGVFPLQNINADMILGRDALYGKRVWISFATRQMFLQPSDSKP